MKEAQVIGNRIHYLNNWPYFLTFLVSFHKTATLKWSWAPEKKSVMPHSLGKMLWDKRLTTVCDALRGAPHLPACLQALDRSGDTLRRTPQRISFRSYGCWDEDITIYQSTSSYSGCRRSRRQRGKRAERCRRTHCSLGDAVSITTSEALDEPSVDVLFSELLLDDFLVLLCYCRAP